MIIDDMTRQGAWLFRWRSYLPLILLPLAFVAFRQSTWVSERLGEPTEEAWDYACLLIAFVGLGLRIATAGYVPANTSGRGTQSIHAATLNSTGMYSLLRHPLYLGNFLIFIAFVLILKSLLFVLFAAVAFFLYYERIMLAEERFLEVAHGDRFRQWAAITPALIPRFRNWKPASLAFSWRTALLREFHGVMLIGTFFFVSELLEALVLEHREFAQWVSTEPVWIVMFAGCTILYMVVMIVKKRTRWLSVAGR
jgi:protein-S-isoprenylcysteine O-methyltransferase Ste14